MGKYDTEAQVDKSSGGTMGLVIIAIIAVLALIGGCSTIGWKQIAGNEIGVKETWEGVESNAYSPGMHFMFPRFKQHMYVYDRGLHNFVMNDKPMAQEARGAGGRDKDAYHVQSKEGQTMEISLNLQWRIDPSKIMNYHTMVRDDAEEKVIRPIVMRVVKDQATKRTAIEAYSGEGLVKLQKDIEDQLKGSGEGEELAQQGIIVVSFVIEHIGLDTAYISEITQKQVATQKSLRSVEEQKAAEAQALVAKSLAQADLNKMVVEAERDKQVQILKAEASNKAVVIAAEAANESAVIAARAEQQKRVLEAEGKRDADIAEAKGVLAMGEAEAKATTLKLQAYAVPGSELYTRIEVAKQAAIAFQGVKGFIPQGMNINTLSMGFEDAIESLMHGTGNLGSLPAK